MQGSTRQRHEHLGFENGEMGGPVCLRSREKSELIGTFFLGQVIVQPPQHGRRAPIKVLGRHNQPEAGAASQRLDEALRVKAMKRSPAG